MGTGTIRFHEGKVLIQVAGQYPTLQEVALENIQNAIDAEAKNIWVSVNHKTRRLTVRDDGTGASVEQFNEALSTVGQTMKNRTSLGQFGIGLVSPLAKCERFTFTSTPKANPNAYTEWMFVTKDIEAQTANIRIPSRKMPELRFSREHDKGVPWRTQFDIQKFTKQRTLNKCTVPSLASAIRERYSVAMLASGAVVHLTVTDAAGNVESEDVVAKRYTGHKLDLYVYRDDDVGKVEFNLYLANKTKQGRQGEVNIGESDNPFRLGFDQFLKKVRHILSNDVVQSLNSGMFEGDITASKLKLHPNRREFMEGDALLGFYIAIETWFREIGSVYAVQIQEDTRDSRRQELGRRSMLAIEDFLSSDEGKPLRDVLGSAKTGTVGKGHTPVGTRELGEQPFSSVAVKAATEKPGEAGGHHGNGGSDPVHKAEHMPNTVAGPQGQKRTSVKGHSVGLQFVFSEMDGDARLWDFDPNSGMLQFNVRHPLWAACEPNQNALMRFQEHIAINALYLEYAPDNQKAALQELVTDMMPATVHLLLNGDARAGRLPGRKKVDS